MHPAKLVTKFLNIVSETCFHVWHRWVFLAWAEYGRGVRFQGFVQCHGVTGEIAFGDRSLIGAGVSLSVANGGAISIGADSSVNKGTVISSLERVTIGNGVRIGEYCSIRDNDHKISGRDRVLGSGFVFKPIVIGDDVWLGRNVTVMPGCVIGEGAVVGANSFVNRDIPAFTIAVGSPVRFIRSR
jgi:acetyltransferase-like isoleucine patch superfamily enzyme